MWNNLMKARGGKEILIKEEDVELDIFGNLTNDRPRSGDHSLLDTASGGRSAWNLRMTM
jgi:hypothetical protein